MVQKSIFEEPQKVVFEMYFVCYLHSRIVSSVLRKNKVYEGFSLKAVSI